MQTVGYNRCIIQVLDKELKPITGDRWVIEGEINKGAGTSFDITGLSKEATKVYGNNVPYLTMRKGTGNTIANLGFLDLPMECESVILGFKKSTNGVTHIGDETEPPYCAVLFESRGLDGEVLGFGMYAGSFSRDGYKAETLNDDDFTPEPGEYVYTPITKKFDDGNHVVGIADSVETFEALEKECFGEVTAAGGE